MKGSISSRGMLSRTATKFFLPRSERERVNEFRGLDRFVASWNDPTHPDNSVELEPRSTPFGNINDSGVRVDYSSHVITRWHPQFTAVIEAGVRDLTCILALEWNWITYSSCAGHQYSRDDMAPAERHVGVLPRNTAESKRILRALLTAKLAAEFHNRQKLMRPVEIVIERGILHCDGKQFDVIDLCFRRGLLRSWRAYFRYLEDSYSAFVVSLKSQ